jgi:outer membrane lipoprotein-sorting protein
MRPTRGFLVIALAALSGVCCPPGNGLHIPESERIEDPKELLTAVREKGKELASLRAEGTILMRRGGKRVKAHTILLLRRPATLRFETISFFEQPLSILVTDGMQFSLWDMDKGRFYTGAATPNNISRVIPIPMDGPEVAKILLGDPPLIPFAKSSLDFDSNDGLYVLTLSNSQQTQIIKIHPGRLRPTEVLCKVAGKEYYRLVYDDWHDQQPPVLKKATFTMPSEDIRLVIKISETERNPVLKDDLFVLTPPEGIPVERLE